MAKKKHQVSDYTFQRTMTLFNEEVIMVLRNKDKKHIISLDEEHRMQMGFDSYDSNNNEHILAYLEEYSYL